MSDNLPKAPQQVGGRGARTVSGTMTARDVQTFCKDCSTYKILLQSNTILEEILSHSLSEFVLNFPMNSSQQTTRFKDIIQCYSYW